jgi:hypothetical protein
MSTYSLPGKRIAKFAVVALATAALRRFWKKIARALSLMAEGFEEAEQLQRRAQRKYPFIGE